MDRDQFLAVAADIYSPLLLLGIAIVIIKHRQTSIRALTAIGVYMVGVYGFMLLDRVASLWPRIGLDYSTHTAFAAVCVWFLWRNSEVPWRSVWLWSLMAYFAAMIHLRYHTVADILSTMGVMAMWIAAYDMTSAMREKIKNGNSDSSQTQACERDPRRDHQ